MRAKRRKTIKRKRRKGSAARRAVRSVAPARQTEVARLKRELHEALEQQAATTAVLKVISSSPGELKTVFQALLENATRVCAASYGIMFLCEEDAFRTAAIHDALPVAYTEQWRSGTLFRPDPDIPAARAVKTRRPAQIADMRAGTAYRTGDPLAVSAVEVAGIRTVAAVPMLKDNEPIGAIAVYRQEVRPFSNKQTELLTNFAAQAVIAIENARLLNELRQRTGDLSEALEQQTATSEVLKVISSSPGDLEPVFSSMLENATRICSADFGVLHRYDGNAFHPAARVNVPVELIEYQRRRGPFVPTAGSDGLSRVFREKAVIHISDDQLSPTPSPPSKFGGARSMIVVPMLKDSELIGAFVIFRQEVRAFTEKQIALLQNFAAQAVIAIENTRLLSELRQRTDDLSESLEQQTATSEVLRVISSSPGELDPVFQSILTNAVRICGAKFGALSFREGNAFRNVAMHGVRPAYLEERTRDPVIVPTSGHNLDRLLRTKAVVHIPDLAADKEAAQALYERAGARALLNVPLLKDNELIGSLMIYREEAGPFSDKQIELVTNFAAQAVIAIENTRLLNELRHRTDDLSESLKQQTATSEVLRVISSSPGDLEPVFQTILENATRICDAGFGAMSLLDGHELRSVALYNAPPAMKELRRRQPVVPRDTPVGLAVETKQVVHFPDVTAVEPYNRAPLVTLAGVRSIIAVPLLKENEAIGVISIYRKEVHPFADKQIELVQNFAAQAVIAIENARLLNELRQRTDDLTEALEQQTATSEVLSVISSSAGELQPVFDTVVANATQLCEAKFGTLFLAEESKFRSVAMHNLPPSQLEARRREPLVDFAPNTVSARAMATRQVIQIEDMAMEQGYIERNPRFVSLVELGGAHSALFAPLIKDGQSIGVIVIFRQEIRRFTDRHIELVKNFAAQAVIAIENTRLLNELRESLQQQTATADVLKTISRSAFDLQRVLETLLESAVSLCNSRYGMIFRYDGDRLRAVASQNTPPGYLEFWEHTPIRAERHTTSGRALLERQPVHVEDVLADADYHFPEAQKRMGYRTVLSVPLLRDGAPLGVISLWKTEVAPFGDKQIELLTTFADQAVIAIENARLLSELRESLQQQTATADVLEVISSSPGDLEPVFDAMLQNAVRICEASFGNLLLYEGDQFRHVALHNAPQAWAAERERDPVPPRNAAHILYRVAETKQVAHIADMAAENPDEPIAAIAGARTVLIVPMLKDQELIGAIGIFRQEVRPFTDKQIELVSNFAAQAVIAIENTRLLNELRQRTDDLTESLEQQTATSEVLKVISSSPGALEPVFQAILANATRICGAQFGTLFRFDDGGVRMASTFGVPPAFAEFARSTTDQPGPLNPISRLRATRETQHIVDYRADVAYLDRDALAVAGVELFGIRTLLDVPMLQKGELIGAIGIFRQQVDPFTEKQIELVQNFAAQAVIAIENARLLSELRESLQQQTATADVLKVISRSTFDLQSVLDTLVESAARLCEADNAAIHRPNPNDGTYPYVAGFGYSPEYETYRKQHPIVIDHGSVMGRAVLSGEPVQITDVQELPNYAYMEAAKIGQVRTVLAAPLAREGVALCVIILTRKQVREFTQKQIDLVTTFADQASIAIENVRLFEEIQDKSRQLAEASQHKSQFLANMSHELRTPLNAILGYTELVLDGIYGETPEKAQAVLKRVESNGRHLLGLINDVLDLSKIEAGELKLALSDYSMKDVVHNVFSAVEPLATKKGLGFKVELPPEIPAGHGDERKLTQVVLNLIGNAIKFTDNGEVGIRVAAADGAFVVAIRDTGPGISAADQGKLFEQFQQADNSITKAKGGTGLGLAISRKIIELHGGSIGVESSPGNGSTFTFTLPVNVRQQARPT